MSFEKEKASGSSFSFAVVCVLTPFTTKPVIRRKRQYSVRLCVLEGIHLSSFVGSKIGSFSFGNKVYSARLTTRFGEL